MSITKSNPSEGTEQDNSPRHYVRFDVYIPVSFRDAQGNEKSSVSDKEIGDFCFAIREEFGGFTESNPASTPPFKGWWASKDIVHIDYLVVVFSLIKLNDEAKAISFFQEWKKKIESHLNQEFVLVTFHPLQVLGQL